MSLATRVSSFFLARLALVLAGFSVTLYLLADAHLHRDLDERLVTALDVLSTSVDVEPGRVEWKPLARPMIKSASSQEDPVLWVVTDGQARCSNTRWRICGKDDIARVLRLSPDVGHIHESFVDRSAGTGAWRCRRIPAARRRRHCADATRFTTTVRARSSRRGVVG